MAMAKKMAGANGASSLGLGIRLIDNVVEPLLIGRSGRVPFSIAFMDVLGGLPAFGIAGVFMGPALPAVAIDVCRQLRPLQQSCRRMMGMMGRARSGLSLRSCNRLDPGQRVSTARRQAAIDGTFRRRR